MKINRSETAALVIDYQIKLVPAMNESEKLIENSCILLKGLKELGIPMYLTQQYTKGLGMSEDVIYEAAGTTEYIDKISYSAYDLIREKIEDKKYILICGMETHICVLQTIIDLREHGYIPVLVTDCVSSRKENDKKFAIKRARDEGAILTTYEAVLFELLEKAGTDEAKVIQKLIR